LPQTPLHFLSCHKKRSKKGQDSTRFARKTYACRLKSFKLAPFRSSNRKDFLTPTALVFRLTGSGRLLVSNDAFKNLQYRNIETPLLETLLLATHLFVTEMNPCFCGSWFMIP